VTATLKATQAKYAEGIMTYANGEFLHHYLTIKNTMTEVIRGDQEQALNEFYALLVHTSSTHAGFEFAILPWGDRNFQDNLAPHGWFAAEYRTLLRNMLVREEGDQLHLLSVVSPAWMGKGKTFSVSNVPTGFGTVGFKFEQTADGEAVLHLDANFTRAPSKIVLHYPWWVEHEIATADNLGHTELNGVIELPSNAREIHLHWVNMPDRPALSYERAVDEYKAEYARRYRTLMHGESAGKN
jgi:hypothetical protein